MVNLAGFSFLIGAILLMFYRAASTSSKINWYLCHSNISYIFYLLPRCG
jgi:hypothetical protein